MNNEISQIHTNCRDCIFSVWNYKTQTGCHVNALKAFKENGVKIVEAYDDNDMQFFVINDKKCRLNTETNPDKLPLKELARSVREKKKLRAQIITNSPYKITEHVQEVQSVKLKLDPVEATQPKVKVTIPFDGRTDLSALLKIACRVSTQSEFLIVAQGDCSAQIDLLPKVNDIINRSMKNVIAVWDKDVILLFSSLFKHIQVEDGKSIEDIAQILSANCTTKAVFTWDEIRQS